MATLIVGLGNPGRKYETTRHNLGFIIIDNLLEEFSNYTKKTKFNGEIYELEKGIILVKPQTYMNLSGICVSKVKNFYKIDGERMLVIHDDLDLPFGRVKIKWDGGSGGHKGVQSIIDEIGTKDFFRLKVGIGRPQNPEQDIVSFVLSDFEEHEFEMLKKVIDFSLSCVKCFMVSGGYDCMNRCNRRTIDNQ